MKLSSNITCTVQSNSVITNSLGFLNLFVITVNILVTKLSFETEKLGIICSLAVNSTVIVITKFDCINF